MKTPQGNSPAAVGKLRTAVVGLGGMGQGHCATLREKVPEMELAAVVDTHAETVQRVAAQYGVLGFMDVPAMLSAVRPDAVLVVVPHPLHAAVAVPCLEAGAHVLCEKPLAECVSGADRILQAAEKHHRTLGIMFQERFAPPVAAAIDYVRSGALGPLVRTLAIIPDFRTQHYYEASPWRATWKGEGGGVLVNQAPHDLDIFVQLAGIPSTVWGRTDANFHRIEVEDCACAMLRYANGANGLLYCSTLEPKDMQLIEVVGERGMLSYRHGRVTCATYSEDLRRMSDTSTEVWGRPKVQAVELPIRDEPSGHFSVMRNFARHILLGEPLRCDAASALGSLELANAVTLSGAMRREISLPVPRAEYDRFLEERRASATFQKKTVAHERVTDPRAQQGR